MAIARAVRRARVVEALADAVATVDHAPPVHVGVDGTAGGARPLADDLARALERRGRRCRRVSLDAGGFLHRQGPGREPVAHRGRAGDDLVLVDGCFLQHPEFLGAWELVVFLREDADQDRAGQLPQPGRPRGHRGRRGRPPRPGLAGGPPGRPGGGRVGPARRPDGTRRRLRHRPGPPPPPGGGRPRRHRHRGRPHPRDAGHRPPPRTRPPALLAWPTPAACPLFHPSGRAALAARHGRRLRDDDLLAPGPLDRLLQGSGWSLAGYDDGPDRFLAQADRITLGT